MAKRPNYWYELAAWLPNVLIKAPETKLQKLFAKWDAERFWGSNRSGVIVLYSQHNTIIKIIEV